MLSEANVCLSWLEECGRIDPIYPTSEGRATKGWPWTEHRPRNDPDRFESWIVRVNEDGHLIFREGKQTVELARFVGKRRLIEQRGGAVLLNGDGFTLRTLQAIQARLRDRTRKVFKIQQTMIVPYQALTGAEIQYDTILPIHVSSDTNTVLRTPIQVPPREARPKIDRIRRSENFMWEGREWRLEWHSITNSTLFVSHQPLNGTSGFFAVHRDKTGHHIREVIHNLGSSVFSAVGPDGERHRYISAFDTQETTPMYFLAQLPDEGECEHYTDALNLLAPPIVHQARREGRAVRRQGDVFAVQTKIDDNDFPKGTKFHRRDDYFNGPILQKARKPAKKLMIYGTGHTASIVAVQPDGTTFLKGNMYHDPTLERSGRNPEHRIVTLAPKNSWFLAVRNTVPRATPRTPTQKENKQ